MTSTNPARFTLDPVSQQIPSHGLRQRASRRPPSLSHLASCCVLVALEGDRRNLQLDLRSRDLSLSPCQQVLHQLHDQQQLLPQGQFPNQRLLSNRSSLLRLSMEPAILATLQPGEHHLLRPQQHHQAQRKIHTKRFTTFQARAPTSFRLQKTSSWKSCKRKAMVSRLTFPFSSLFFPS